MSASRRAFWVRGGLLALVVFALLAFTLHSLRLSDASFTTASTNTSNVFIAGTLGHSNNYSGQVMISMTGMEPGSSVTKTMTLTGTGNVAGDYSLSVASVLNTPDTAALSGQLVLTVDDITEATTPWDDTIAELQAADPLPDLGTIGPGEMHTYDVTLSYPDGTDDGTLQGASMTAVLQVSGVSP